LDVNLGAGQTEAIRADGTVAGTLFQDTSSYSYFLDPSNAGNSLIVAGSVGIATTSPRYKLDVWGDMAVGTSTGVGAPQNYPLLYVQSGGGGTSNGVGIGTTTVSGTMFTVGTTTPSLVVSQSGYVGIGTATPQELLHVGAGTDASDDGSSIAIFTAAGSANLAIRDSTNNIELLNWAGSDGVNRGYGGTRTNHIYTLRTNNTNALTIDTSQNVGIGILILLVD